MKKNVAVLLFLSLFCIPACKKSGELTNSDAERTIKKAFALSGNFTVTVNRIQGNPMANVAEADATLNGFPYIINGKSQTPYSGFARAVFQHFNTGWVLKQFRIENGAGGSVMFNVDQAVE